MSAQISETPTASVTGSDLKKLRADLTGSISASSAASSANVSSTAAALQGLITETAAIIQSRVDSLETELRSDYLAQSDFGTYTETLETRLQATAGGVTEAYQRISALDSGFTSFRSELSGEIRRGVVTDPDTGRDVLGIAIAQQLYFQENALPYVDADSNTWYRLAPARTFALYTSTGWQYWINGAKVGWFASEDSSLHLNSAVVNSSVTFGTAWELRSDSAGFGLKFNG